MPSSTSPSRHLPNTASATSPSDLLTLSASQANQALSSSLESLFAHYPPKSSYTAHEISGLFNGPTSVSYLLLKVHDLFPKLRIRDLSQAVRARETEPEGQGQEERTVTVSALSLCKAYLRGTRPYDKVDASHCGVGNEALSFLAVTVAVTAQDAEGDAREQLKYIRSFLSYMPQILTAAPAPPASAASTPASAGISNEWLYGRAGTLYLLRMMLKYAPHHGTMIRDAMLETCHAIMAQGPDWTWHGKRYFGAVHGDVGILTQLALSLNELSKPRPVVKPASRGPSPRNSGEAVRGVMATAGVTATAAATESMAEKEKEEEEGEEIEEKEIEEKESEEKENEEKKIEENENETKEIEEKDIQQKTIQEKKKTEETKDHDLAASARASLRKLEPLARHLLSQQLADGNFPCHADRPEETTSKLVQFCHGAPGVVISLRALLDRDIFPSLEKEMETAIERSQNLIWERGLLTKEPCLCHGIAGNAIALAAAGGKEKDGSWEHFVALTTPERVAEGIEKREYRPSSDGWGLFYGLAGRIWGLVGVVQGKAREGEGLVEGEGEVRRTMIGYCDV